MASLFGLSISLLIPFSAGYALLLWLDLKHAIPLSLKIALAYGLGLGLLAIWMLCLGILQQNFSLFSIGMPLIIVSSLFMILSLKRGGHIKITKARDLSPKSTSQQGFMKILKAAFITFLIVFIAQNIIYVFWRSMAIPISEWDAIATIAFKAKIFFFEQSLPSLDLLPHKTYPLFVPFIESWIAFNLGYWDEILVKIIFPCAFLAYLTIHYKFLVHFTGRTWALFGCAILLSSNFFIYHATISYRDFFLMYFNCTAITLLLLWNQNKTNSFLILAALFAGFATFTKLEGTGYLLIHTILLLVVLNHNNKFSWSDKLKNFSKFTIPSFSICLLFHIYKFFSMASTAAQKTEKIAGFDLYKIKLNISLELLSNVSVVLHRFLENLFMSNNWNIIWFILFISLFKLKKKNITIEIKILITALVLFFGIYIAGYSLTQHYYWVANTRTVLSRCILHFFPLATILIILINFPSKSTRIKE